MLAVRITEERERHGGSALLAHVSRAEGGSSSSFAPSLDPTGLDRERRQMHEELRSAAGIRRSDAALLQHLETKHVGSAPFSIALAKLREQDTRDIPLLTYVVAEVACAVATEPEAARLPEDAAAVVASTLQALDLGVLEKKVPVSAGAAGRERQQAQWIARRQVVAERSNAVAALLEVLLGLVRRRPEDEAYMRSLVMMDSLCEDGWLRCLLRLMCEGADVGTVVTAANASTSSTCAPFEKGCQLLAHLARDSEEVAKVLVGAGVLKVVGSLISRSTGNANTSASSPSVDLGTEWLPFVTAAVCLIDAVVAEEDIDRFQISNPSLFRPMWAAGDRPAAFVDGIMAALERSLNVDSGNMVVQQLHLCGLRALWRAARCNGDMAQRIICRQGFTLGAKVLRIPGADEEAAHVALRFLATLCESCPHVQRQLSTLGLKEEAEKFMTRYSWSKGVKQAATILLKHCEK